MSGATRTATSGSAAIASFAKAHGYRIIDEFYDAAVSGADPVAERPGFKAMLDRIAGNGVRVILVESPDRFARDLSVQITGHDYLRSLGVELVPTVCARLFSRPTRPQSWCGRCSGPSTSLRRQTWSPN